MARQTEPAAAGDSFTGTKSASVATVSMAQRIVVLDKGRVVETGTHAELLARAGHYATLYSLHERTGLRAAG